MAKFKKYGLLLVAVLSFLTCEAQKIDTVYWTPASPTVGDSIYLVVEATLSSAPCSLESQLVTPGDPITVDGFYCIGSGGTCSTTDMINLGLFAAGNYNVRFQLSEAASGCTGYMLKAIENVSFTVGNSTGIENKLYDLNITVFPNPNMGSMYISYDLPAGLERPRLIIYDVTGKSMKEIPITDLSGKVTLEEDWESGYFFYQIVAGNLSSKLGKIVISQ